MLKMNEFKGFDPEHNEVAELFDELHKFVEEEEEKEKPVKAELKPIRKSHRQPRPLVNIKSVPKRG